MARKSGGSSTLGGLGGLLIVGGALGVSFTAGAMFMKWLAGQSPVPLPLSAYTLPGRGPDPETSTINVFSSNVTYDDEGNFVYDYDGDGGGGDYGYDWAGSEEGAYELPA